MGPHPDWLDFHSRRIGGPVANVRSRSGVVRVEAGDEDVAAHVHVGIPDDEAWSAFADTLEASGFWEWPAETGHREPHKPGDFYWWLEVRHDGREHRAAAWNEEPAGLEQVRKALFELIEQVVPEPAYDV